MDHGRVWLMPDGRRAILAHVYSSDPAELLGRAQGWAAQVGLVARLGDALDDWYYPGWAVPIWYELPLEGTP
jgi:hypothetical protein